MNCTLDEQRRDRVSVRRAKCASTLAKRLSALALLLRADRTIFERLQYIHIEVYTASDADIAAPAIVQFVPIFYADMEKRSPPTRIKQGFTCNL